MAKSWKPTPRQQKFIDFYDGNATDAARKAGYKFPDRAGYRLLRNIGIRKRLEAREEKTQVYRIATRQDRQHFWSEMMGDKGQKTSDRLKASELLGRSQADFIDRTENSGNISQLPIETNNLNPKEKAALADLLRKLRGQPVAP